MRKIGYICLHILAKKMSVNVLNVCRKQKQNKQKNIVSFEVVSRPDVCLELINQTSL